jgi:hypothetical protein
MMDTKKLFFCMFYHRFFGRQFSNGVKLSKIANLFLDIASKPKTTRLFSGGIMGNFFEDIFV